MRRIPLLIGNWKMYKTDQEACAFIEALKSRLEHLPIRLGLAVPFTALAAAAEAAEGSPLLIGAQNMHDATDGAYTGEVSARMLIAAGAQFVILGHSERRHIFGETDPFIHRKVQRALSEGITPVLCIGESEEERSAGKTETVLAAQLAVCLRDLSAEKLILAYEPVWAIGTGKTATPEMAQEVHHFCRAWIQDNKGIEAARHLTILYGGSVKAENVAALCSQPDIDGALIGGASLDLDSFFQIISKVKL